MNRMPLVLVLFFILAQVLTACTGTAAEPMTAPTQPPAPTSAPLATATAEPVDPAKVVQAFWDAMEAGDVDTAMTFVAEDAQCKGSCYFKGKDSFRAYLQGIINSGSTNQITIVNVDGDIVTYTYKVFRNGIVVEDNAEGESMTLQDGQIIFWNNMHF
jgi:ketosteroid isomerase-like protein